MEAPSDSMVDPSAIEGWRRRIREDVFSNYHLEMGLALERTGAADAALAAYNRALDARPDAVEAAYLSELLAQQLGRGPAADAAAGRGSAIDPDFRSSAPFRLGLTALERGQSEQAFRWFQVSHDCGRADAAAGMVAAQLTAGKRDQAVALALRMPVTDSPAGPVLAAVIVRQTELWMAEIDLWPDNYLPLLRLAFRLAPDDVWIKELYGHTLLTCVETGESEAVFAELAGRGGTTRGGVHEAQGMMAAALAARGERQAALELLDGVLRQDPTNILALVESVSSLLALGRVDAASKPLAEARHLRPDLPVLEAYALRLQGITEGLETVLPDFQELARRYPTDVRVQLNLALVALAAGQNGIATDAVRMALTGKKDQFWINLVLLPGWQSGLLKLCRHLQVPEMPGLAKLLASSTD